MKDISIQLADYILNIDKEKFDFINWCHENNYEVSVNKNTIKHIYGKTLYFMFNSGYDIDFLVDYDLI